MSAEKIRAFCDPCRLTMVFLGSTRNDLGRRVCPECGRMLRFEGDTRPGMPQMEWCALSEKQRWVSSVLLASVFGEEKVDV